MFFAKRTRYDNWSNELPIQICCSVDDLDPNLRVEAWQSLYLIG
jgi:hypothetical protein